MFVKLINGFFTTAGKLKFDALIWIILASFAAVFLLALLLSLKFQRLRQASKRPFLCICNAYTAVIFAAFLSEAGLSESAVAAALFWLVSYLFYGLLCAAAKYSRAQTSPPPSPVRVQPAQERSRAQAERPSVPAAKTGVRLEHALSVTDKLLQKDLSKSDRQELEKLKNTLAVLQLKGSLSPVESDILNENFNALLKLMAKYNI